VCPPDQEQICNTENCPLLTTPIVTVLGTASETAWAQTLTPYVDGGATCYDETDGNLDTAVEESGASDVQLGIPGTYAVKYSCVNSQNMSGVVKTRHVVVHNETSGVQVSGACEDECSECCSNGLEGFCHSEADPTEQEYARRTCKRTCGQCVPEAPGTPTPAPAVEERKSCKHGSQVVLNDGTDRAQIRMSATRVSVLMGC